MGRRLVQMAQGLLSTLFTLLLLVGPPIALVKFVGWPLPEGLPTMDEFTAASRSGIDDAVIIKALAILGWLVWAQIAVALLAEFGSVVRGLPAPSLPVLPGFQTGAGRLLASCALLFTSVTATRQPVPLQPTVVLDMAPISQVVEADTATAPNAHAPPSSLPRAESATPSRTYVVEPNDSWWELAERTLGDGLRWQELRSMNVGRAMPDGATISASTEVLEVGWVLALPGDAVDETADWVPAAEVVVERGDNLWELSEEHLENAADRELSDDEIAPYWADVVAENTQFADPNVINPGDVVALPSQGDAPVLDQPLEEGPQPPGDPAPSLSPEIETPDPAVPSSTTTSSTTTVVSAPPADPAAGEAGAIGAFEEDDTRSVGGLLGVGGSMLAVGLAAEVIRRRRRREQLLPAGTRAPSPPAALDELRSEVVRTADYDLAATLAGGLETVAQELADRRHPARVRVVQGDARRLDVLLSEPVVPAPEGWSALGSGTAWTWEPDEAPSGALTVTHPSIVCLGAPDDDGQVFLDLEAEGLVNVVGDSDEVAAFVRSLTYELAVSPMSEGTNLVIVGDIETPADGLDRVQRVETWSDIADSALAWAHQTRDLLAANRWSTPSAGRAVGERSDDLSPLIVVLGEEPDDERFTALCTVISESIVPLVVVGVGTAIEGATLIEVSDGELRIPTLDLVCRAQGISEELRTEVDSLLEVSEALPEPAELLHGPPVQLTLDEDGPDGPYVDPPFDILVRVLGDIEVIGGHRPLRPKQLAVVAFVALNTPVSSSRVEDAIWSAPTENRKRRLANTISQARGALGAEHFPAANDGKYRAGRRVLTDLELFERRLKVAVGQEPDDAIETLRGAVDLVTGPVFTYRNTDRAAYGWVDSGNWISDVELKVTSAAADLAQRYLDVGDAEGAAWASRRGLLASPTHAQLTRLLMDAHTLAGDAQAAAQVFTSYANSLQQIGIDEVEDELSEAYERIRARSE